MVYLKKISLYQLPELIQSSYKDDEDLLNKFHVAKFDLNEAVLSTFGMIKQLSIHSNPSYYKVIYNKEPIGYVVTFDNFLYSFAIAVKYRKASILNSWWQSIKLIFRKEFMCMLFGNNTRAINWLKKCGMQITNIDEQNNTVTLCQLTQ